MAPSFPKHRRNVKIDNLTLLSALTYRCNNACKWRNLPKFFDNWHMIYIHLNHWAQKGMLKRVFKALVKEKLLSDMLS
ncbi:MAG: transposase [Spirochaetaceae bacterium]|nr:transposase [Spirochaetaceae bacterium]